MSYRLLDYTHFKTIIPKSKLNINKWFNFIIIKQMGQIL